MAAGQQQYHVHPYVSNPENKNRSAFYTQINIWITLFMEVYDDNNQQQSKTKPKHPILHFLNAAQHSHKHWLLERRHSCVLPAGCSSSCGRCSQTVGRLERPCSAARVGWAPGSDRRVPPVLSEPVKLPALTGDTHKQVNTHPNTQ